MTASLPPNKIAFLSAALLLVGCAAPAPQGQLWGYYKPELNFLELAPSPTATMSFYRGNTSEEGEYWTAKLTKSGLKNGVRIREELWTSSKTCPALLTVIADARALRAYDDVISHYVSDTSPASIKVEGGSPNLTSDPPFQKREWKADGAISKWSQSAEEKLQGCWSKRPPRTPGH